MYCVAVVLIFYFNSFQSWGHGETATVTSNPAVFAVDDYGHAKLESVQISPISGVGELTKFRQKRSRSVSVFSIQKLAGVTAELAFCGDRIVSHDDPQRYDHPFEEMFLGRRSKRQAAGNFVIETIVVLDHPLFLFWRARNKDRTSTIQEMVDYYSNIIESVNRRYDSVKSSGFTIDIAVNAFIIAENPSNSPWTQTLNSSNFIDANRALDNLNAFLQSSGGAIALIPYDHAFIITGFDLTIGNQNSIAGIAQYRTCSVRSGSITEETRSAQTALIIAHEIGHALSSRHDGSRNSCNRDDNFIMAPTISVPPRRREANPWLFSQCSISYMRDFLGSSSGSCTRRLAGKPLNLSPFLTEPFGQKYPPDVQCEIFLGEGSKFCRHLYDGTSRTFDDMCRTLFCDDPNSNFCYSIPAHDGTSCNNGKWCQKGTCVTSLAAPSTPENCPAGDDPDLICTLSSCSDPTTRDYLCCATCKTFLTTPVNTMKPSTRVSTTHKTTTSSTSVRTPGKTTMSVLPIIRHRVTASLFDTGNQVPVTPSLYPPN